MKTPAVVVFCIWVSYSFGVFMGIKIWKNTHPVQVVSKSQQSLEKELSQCFVDLDAANAHIEGLEFAYNVEWSRCH